MRALSKASESTEVLSITHGGIAHAVTGCFAAHPRRGAHASTVGQA
jgi:hypothetical protein